MPTSRRRSKRRHRAAHGTEHPVRPVPAWTDDEQWFEPDDAHTGWVEQLYHEPAPWRSEENYDHSPHHGYRPYDDYPPPDYPLPDEHRPPPGYPRLPADSPDPDYLASPADPRAGYAPHQEYVADDYDEGYEQHGPDETPALRGRLVRLPRPRAEMPEAVRDCLHWGIFALILVPIFLVATGGSVLNAIIVMISILILGVVVIWVVRLGKIALPNLEPAHQLEPLVADAQDPIEGEWQEAPESAGPAGPWPESAAVGSDWPEPASPPNGDWPEPGAADGDWPEPSGPNDEWRDRGAWPHPPRPGSEWPEPAWEPFLPAQPDEREHVGWPPRDQ